jgi:hypothetical protein
VDKHDRDEARVLNPLTTNGVGVTEQALEAYGLRRPVVRVPA